MGSSVYPKIARNVKKSLENSIAIMDEMPVKKKERALYSKKLTLAE